MTYQPHQSEDVSLKTPSTLDEWAAFVAWARSRGYDLNNRNVRHSMWAGWMARARGVSESGHHTSATPTPPVSRNPQE